MSQPSAGKHKINSDSDNASWLERSLLSVWHPCTQMQHHSHSASAGNALPLIPISHAQGAWLYDFSGQRYLDGISSWWVNLFGHAHPRINAAIRDQLETLEHVMLAGFTHAPAIELAERLSALSNHELGHAFFASDGSSAVEIALKMSFHYWRNNNQEKKQKFICLENSYHGETLGALAVTDIRLFRDAYSPLLYQSHLIDSPDARQAQPNESAIDVAQRAALALEAYLQQHHETTAALIVEPLVQCAGGMGMHDPLYLKQARKLCDQYNVHLICDEIAVGCGRTGSFFAHDQAGIRPDLLCLSKGISGGYLPLSVVLCQDKIYQAFYDTNITRAFLHSHSYTGNPLACKAALATLDLFDELDTIQNNLKLSAQIFSALAPVAQRPFVKHLRHCGMIFAFDVDTADLSFSQRFYNAALKNKVLIRPLGNTVYIMPPYILNKDEAIYLAEATVRSLDDALS